MKKYLGLVLSLLMFVFVSVPSFAANGTIDSLSVSLQVGSAGVSGTTTGVNAAVIVEVLSTDETVSYGMGSIAVRDDGSFSGTVSNLNLSYQTEYVVRVADYDGGTWEKTTKTTPAASTGSSGAETGGGNNASASSVASAEKSTEKVTAQQKANSKGKATVTVVEPTKVEEDTDSDVLLEESPEKIEESEDEKEDIQSVTTGTDEKEYVDAEPREKKGKSFLVVGIIAAVFATVLVIGISIFFLKRDKQ